MRKISGEVVSTKAVALPRAAEIVSRFAAVDNGSSPAVSLYLQRTAEAFNHLVQFHGKRKSPNLVESRDSEKRSRELEEDGVEDVEIPKTREGDSERKKKKKKKKSVD